MFVLVGFGYFEFDDFAEEELIMVFSFSIFIDNYHSEINN